jgi:hypothetical protein
MSARRDEIVVHLDRPEDLVSTDPMRLLGDDADRARTVRGVDELLNELLGRRRVTRTNRVVLTVPSAVLTDDTAHRLTTAVARWTACGSRRSTGTPGCCGGRVLVRCAPARCCLCRVVVLQRLPAAGCAGLAPADPG